jgi:hypothetical protein
MTTSPERVRGELAKAATKFVLKIIATGGYALKSYPALCG